MIYLSHKGLHILAFASKHILVLLFLIGVLFCFSMLCPMMHNINFVEWLLMCCSSLGFTHHHFHLLLHHHLLLHISTLLHTFIYRGVVWRLLMNAISFKSYVILRSYEIWGLSNIYIFLQTKIYLWFGVLNAAKNSYADFWVTGTEYLIDWGPFYFIAFWVYVV